MRRSITRKLCALLLGLAFPLAATIGDANAADGFFSWASGSRGGEPQASTSDGSTEAAKSSRPGGVELDSPWDRHKPVTPVITAGWCKNGVCAVDHGPGGKCDALSEPGSKCSAGSCTKKGCTDRSCTDKSCTSRYSDDSGDVCYSCGPSADPCPKLGFYAYSGVESFRGLVDQGVNNNGIINGMNMGVPLPLLGRLGFGAQAGMQYGLYDFMGRSTNGLDEEGAAQQQLFVTFGVFRRADENCHFTGGLAYDWMVNNNYGAQSMEPTLGQWRGQVGYAFNTWNELGVRGSLRDRSATMLHAGSNTQITFRPIDQLALYWHHKFGEEGMDGWMWVGAADDERLNTVAGGSLIDFTLGVFLQAPIGERTALYGGAQYAKPSAAQGIIGSLEDSVDVFFGLAWYPGGWAKSSNVAGRKWMPLMPVANNSLFLVDRN